jgi:superfamily I DNA/RNA helicase
MTSENVEYIDYLMPEEIEMSTIDTRSVASGLKQGLSEWLSNTLEGMDSDQREVLSSEIDGVHSVLANAGSGKTHCIISRAVKQIVRGVRPSNIVLITFTTKSALEIRARLGAVYKGVACSLLTEALSYPYVGTIHSFARTVLLKAGVRGFTVLSEYASQKILNRVVCETLGEERLGYGSELQNSIRRIWGVITDLMVNNELHYFCVLDLKGATLDSITSRCVLPRKAARKVESLNGVLRYLDGSSGSVLSVLSGGDSSASLADLLQQSGRDLATIKAEYASRAGLGEEELGRVLRGYLVEKYKQRGFEYVDLLYFCQLYLLCNQDSIAAVQREYTHFMVDEAQDVDSLQHSFLRAVCGVRPNMMLVGDTKQTLYYWRNARPELLSGLANLYVKPIELPLQGVVCVDKVTELHLRYNYRSTPALIRLANLFSDCFGEGVQHSKVGVRKEPSTPPVALVGGVVSAEKGEQLDPPLKDKKPRIRVLGFDSSLDEYRFIAEDIKSLVAGGVPLGDIAVIARVNRVLLDMEAALMKQKLSYQLSYDKEGDVKQSTFLFMKYLYNCVLDNRDLDSLSELLLMIRGIGERFVEKVRVRLGGYLEQGLGDKWTIYGIPQDTSVLESLGFGISKRQGDVLCKVLYKVLMPYASGIAEGVTRIPELNAKLIVDLGKVGRFSDDTREGRSGLQFEFTRESVEKALQVISWVYREMEKTGELFGLSEYERLFRVVGVLELGVQGEWHADRIQLSTGHLFKGREAEYVYVIGMNSSKRNAFEEEYERDDKCWHYVAYTRARKGLIVSGARVGAKGEPLKKNPYVVRYLKCLAQLNKEAEFATP